MKKIVSLICCFVLLFSLAACEKKAEQKIIEITASEDTIAFREAMYDRLGYTKKTEEEIMKNYYEVYLPILNARTEQAFPQVEVKNTLEKLSYEYGDVYTFSGEKQDKIVFYIHGGAWVWEINERHVDFCDKLVDALGAKVYAPIYPLAPEADYEETFQMLDQVYEELLKQDKPIYIMGDSAGATITLDFVHRLMKVGKELPEKVVVMAPAADLSFSNEEIADYQTRDGMLCSAEVAEEAKLWANGADLTSPEISPLYGDYKDFPDTLMFAGDCDILCADDLKLYEKMCSANMNVTLVKGYGLWHVFPVFKISEQQQCLDIISDFCK